MHFDLPGKMPYEAIASQAFGSEKDNKAGIFFCSTFYKWKKGEFLEPRSVLDQRRSPSPPTSTSTWSSSLENLAYKWPTIDSIPGDELLPIPRSLDMGIEGWETMLSESSASSSQDQTFRRLIMGDIDDSLVPKYYHHQLSPVEFDAGTGGLGFGLVDPGFSFENFRGMDCAGSLLSSQPPFIPGGKNASFANPSTGINFHEPFEEKLQLFDPSPLLDSHQQIHTLPSPGFFLSLPSIAAAEQPQSNNSMLADHLFKAAELIESGNFVSTHEILARLNHQIPSPIGRPIIRSAFYFKEALKLLLCNYSNPPPAAIQTSSHHHRTPISSPLDVLLKLSAYKAFSEASPLFHFTNFGITQALLEELGDADCIHIIDFDIGVGEQWPSFMQELAQRSSPAVRLLKITAFISPRTFHALELSIIRDCLSHFASDVNIPFQINFLSIDSFNPDEIFVSSPGSNEAIAVILPVRIGLVTSLSTLLLLTKKLLPKIVLVVDVGSDKSELPFSQHFLQAFHSSTILLDSIDAASCNIDMVDKIERLVLQPKIENCIIGRYLASDNMLPWRTLFVSAGFVQTHFSNFTETLVECLLKRVPVKGFHVEKRQASLYLYWQQGELASISVWKC